MFGSYGCMLAYRTIYKISILKSRQIAYIESKDYSVFILWSIQITIPALDSVRLGGFIDYFSDNPPPQF